MDEYEDEDGSLFLGGDEFDGLVVSVPGGLSFPCIYAPMPRYGDLSVDYYGGRIPLDCLPPELHDQVPHKTSRSLPELGPSVIVKGRTRPEVVPETRLLRAIMAGEVEHSEEDARRGAELKLVELIERLGARNLNTDRLFIGRPLRIELRGTRMGPEFQSRYWRHMPDHVIRGYEDKFILTPTKVWVEVKEGE